jgi:ankyrin repeat protein
MRAIHGHYSEIAELLIDAGADVSADNRYGVTPLHLAARGGDAASAWALLRAGADPNTSLPEGETVLMTAAKAGSADVVRALLTGIGESPDAPSSYAAPAPATRAEVNAREGWYGQTALMWAAAKGHADVVRLLLDAGANVDEYSARVDVPEPNPGRIAGAFADPRMPTGHITALHFAAREGHTDAVRALIDGGADLNATDEEGTPPLGYAASNDRLEVARVLLEAGAAVNTANRLGATALHQAALSGSAAMIQLLVAHGADVRAQNVRGQTPLDMALSDGRVPRDDSIANLLRELAPHP